MSLTNIKFHIIALIATILILTAQSWAGSVEYNYSYQQQISPPDSTETDSLSNIPYTPTKRPTFTQKDRFGDPFSNSLSPSPLLLQDPASLKLDLEIDTAMNYTIYEKIGDINYRPTSSMTFQEFNKYRDREILKSYWRNRSSGLDGESAVSGRRLIPKIYISPVFDRIFGGSYVDIEPTGFVNLDFGGRWQRINNPAIPINLQRNGGFNFNQQISMNVVGKVGEKLAITANFDNNNTFDFQNNLKVEYTGYAEDIIKKIEIGNVSMNVSNSLMSGGQTLFGLKTQLQFGKLFVTAIATRQQSTTRSFGGGGGGAAKGEFEIVASSYDGSRHFFLGHFFRDNYEAWHERVPNINSGLLIRRVDVYVVNNNGNTETLRNVIGLMDLGEGERVHNPRVPNATPGSRPNDNKANQLFAQLSADSRIRDIGTAVDYLQDINGFNMENTVDFEIKQARKLKDNEYKINEKLGYITLNRKLNDSEALAIAYEYTFNGQVFKVGELAEDYPGESDEYHIILKLLRPSFTNTRVPTWDLEMKNIYNLQTRSIDRMGFKLEVIYKDDNSGLDNPSLNEGANIKDEPLIRLLGLDRLNINNDPQRDGNFDFIEDVTIDLDAGNMIFPVLEPFGSTLRSFFNEDEQVLKDRYVFDSLYRNTQIEASQIFSHNKFFIVGKNKSSSSNKTFDVGGFNVNPEAVTVKVGGRDLVYGVDYIIDFSGKGTIINQGIANSNQQIEVSYESPDMFSFQSKWLSGVHFDYRFNEKTNLGATVMHYNEKTNGIIRFPIGQEPLRNTKYGFDFSFQDESRLLTKIIDALPLLNTKEKSSVTFSAEFAKLLPGISIKENGEGTTYIDDFENTVTPRFLGNPFPWKLGSTPKTFDDRFNQSASDLSYGYKRAKIAWYSIDNAFYRTGGNRPSNISEGDLTNNYVKPVIPQDIFRERDRQVININEATFDIAYYPSERGQYNYNPNLTPNGKLPNPEENFGAITMNNTNPTNWQANNVEYVEFWLMDPFISGENGLVIDGVQSPNITGGDLVFNFGTVAVDINKDNERAFEQGLPADGSDADVTLTPWGKVPSNDYLLRFFDNDADARINQDVGLDGLKSSEEEAFFNDSFISQVTPQAVQHIVGDVSADDFEYFLGENHDVNNAKILERYKNFNGMEGNSPLQIGNQGFSPSSSNVPDDEVLRESDNIVPENFFEYRVKLKPGELKVNEGYIIDKITDLSGEADWYLFRIPVKSPDRVVGNAQFSNIKYHRIYLTGWSQPVVLRMVKLQTVTNNWRKATLNLKDVGFGEIPEPNADDFEVSVVNIEENSVPTDGNSPYVIPPGIERNIDTSTTINRQENEQSIRVCVENLEDGDARAIFKDASQNMIQYKKIRMFFHAETNGDETVQDGDLTAFIRLGNDQGLNYYEIEVPLQITRENDLSATGDALRRAVWPLANEIELPISELIDLKSQRNKDPNFDPTKAFSRPSANGKYRLTIKGYRPDLSDVKVMMIGVRNPTSNDLLDKSICIWANELRVSGLEKNDAWAANARLSVKLADFATVNASTKFTSVGFGGIQNNILQRTLQETTQYDVSATVNLDKLIPAKTGLKIPMFISMENSIAKPQFDPLDPDTKLNVTLLGIEEDKERAAYEDLVNDRSTRRSINFTNVRKEKVKADAKSHIYDIENFSFSYSYSEAISTNVNTASNVIKQSTGGITYTYSPKAPPIEPFKESKAFSGKYLQLIKDLNISLLPSNISVRADLNRRFARKQLRNRNLTTEGVDPFFEKFFTFNRSYNVRWNLFKSLNLDYSARTNAIVDEPEGDLDTQVKRDSVINSLKNLGRMKDFDQTASATYRLPLDKIPLTDWISADVKYATGYKWTSASIDQVEEFGNIISNNRDKSLTGKVDMVKLYNKVGFLKKINTPPRRSRNASARNARIAKTDTTKAKKDNKLLKGLMRTLMSLRSLNFTYSNRQSTELPGFRPRAYLFGLDSGFAAPGLGFIFGGQDPNIRYSAAQRDWLVKSPTLTSSFRQSFTEDISLRASIEPAKDIKIQLDMKRSNTANFQEIFRYEPQQDPNTDNGFRSLTPSRGGSYNITFMAIKTAFEKSDTISSPTFSNFEEYRSVVQARLNAKNPNSEGSYGLNSQDVLIPAFIAAYSGKSPESVALTPFPKIPLPNWRLDYAGLSKIPALKDIFSSINITHAYSSNLSISNYTNSSAYSGNNLTLDNDITNYPLASIANDKSELVPVYIINDVTISERFSPLIGINIRTKNRTTMKLEWKKERMLSLNLSNSQMNEVSSSDVAFDFGFSKEKMKLPFKIKGRTSVINNEIQFRMTLTVRDTKTVQRKLDDVATITNGNINYQLRPQLSYSANSKLNLTMYFERNINRPRVSNSFDRANTAFGITMRFSLAQ